MRHATLSFPCRTDFHPFHARRRRSAKTIALFVLTAPVLIGMMGLVVDGGLLMAAYRQTQNAADAAAMGAALDKFKGASDSTALATAQSLVTDNGVSATLTLNGGASNALNIPPQDPGNTGSPYKGAANYVEAMVTQTVNTLFIQVLGIGSSQVTARAVAGFEPVGAGEGAFVLDSTAAPGIQINNNNARLIVNGDITVNSPGGGTQYDQYGNLVPGPYNAAAVKPSYSLTTPAPIVATTVNAVGGVSNIDNIRAYDPAFSGNGYYYDPNNPDRPFFAYAPTAPDPLVALATPTASNGVVNTFWQYDNKTGQWTTALSPQDVSMGNNDTVTFRPGIYRTISITGGSANFPAGIYVVGPGFGGGGNTFNINGGSVDGTAGIMVYNTGSDYTATNPPDVNAGNNPPSPPGSTKFGSVSVNGGTVNLSPLSDVNSPFWGLSFYQRRWNTTTVGVGGSSNAVNLAGTLYAKWAQANIAGQGKYNAQFLVGSIAISGNAAVTINATGKQLGKANLVFLVE